VVRRKRNRQRLPAYFSAKETHPASFFLHQSHSINLEHIC
jgi:hypothetical protein